MKITDYLKKCNYDYMPAPIGDGSTDNSKIIQNRIDEGLASIPYGYNGKMLISKTIQLAPNTLVLGNK